MDERDYEGRRRLRGRDNGSLFCVTEGVLLRGRGHYALAGAALLQMRMQSLLRMALRRLSLRYDLTGDDVVNRARQYSGGEEGVYCEVGGYGEASGAMLSVRVVMDSLPVWQVFFLFFFFFFRVHPRGEARSPME